MESMDETQRELGIQETRQRLHDLLEQYVDWDTKLRKLEDTEFRVCIFGSARIRPEDPTYQTVFRLAKALGELGVDIVTGGGPGLMEAANRGVQAAKNERARSYGLPIELPRVVEPPNKHLDIKSDHRRFSSRLDEFMRLTHAVIVAPGGIGTLLELMYVWQLLQVGMIESRPVILLGRRFWAGLIAWIRNQPLGKGLIGPHDLDHIHLVDSSKEVVKIIRTAVQAYQRQHQEAVASMPEESRGPTAGHLMRAAVEQAAVAAPEAVSAAAPVEQLTAEAAKAEGNGSDPGPIRSENQRPDDTEQSPSPAG
jgi:uncharacterized protein (TIGR00730 family)